MPHFVDISASVQLPADTMAALEQAISSALDMLVGARSTEVAVVLDDDAYLRSLNRRFRHEDHATDVLSFPSGEDVAEESASPGRSDTPLYLGDIAISVPFAQRQAEQQGHSLLDELQLLAIHGVLHLVGYDHDTGQAKTAMWAQQQAILARLGLGHVQPSEGDYEP